MSSGIKQHEYAKSKGSLTYLWRLPKFQVVIIEVFLNVGYLQIVSHYGFRI